MNPYTLLHQVGIAVAPHIRSYLMPSFNDSITTFVQLSSPSVKVGESLSRVLDFHIFVCIHSATDLTSPFFVSHLFRFTPYSQNQIANQNVTFQRYLSLFMPAMDWIMQCVAYQVCCG
jgi:hypothetical protein